jgi:alpha-N-acetylglucosamine transferase
VTVVDAAAGFPGGADWSRSQGSGQAPVTVVDAAAGFPGGVDWSRFAYTQYVTNNDYLCNSVMVFERLHHLGSRADRVMMYPSYMLDPDAATSGTSLSNDARLLFKARDEYNARLVPINVQQRAGEDSKFPLPLRPPYVSHGC